MPKRRPPPDSRSGARVPPGNAPREAPQRRMPKRTQRKQTIHETTEGIRTRARRHLRRRKARCQTQADDRDGRNRRRGHHPQPHTAPYAVRRGGARRAGRFHPPAGRHPARDGQAYRRRQIHPHQRRTPLAGGPACRHRHPAGLHPRGGRRKPPRHGPGGEHPAAGPQRHRNCAGHAAPHRRVPPHAGRSLGEGGQEALLGVELPASAQAPRRGAARTQGGTHLDGPRQGHRRRPGRRTAARAEALRQEGALGPSGRGARAHALRPGGTHRGTRGRRGGVSRKLFAAGRTARKALLAGHQHQTLEIKRSKNGGGKIVIGFADDRDIENFLERFGKRS